MTINAPKIEMPAAEARRLFRKYREHQHYSKPEDDEIRRTYQLIAQGRVVIRAIEAVKLAGLNADGLPVLAIGAAWGNACFLRCQSNGSASMSVKEWDTADRSRARISFQAGSFSFPQKQLQWRNHKAIMPTIPLHLRPRRGIENYHVLWEAEWTPIPPADPLLLRRIGKADLWLVVAAWDLTPVEQAVMAGRMNG